MTEQPVPDGFLDCGTYAETRCRLVLEAKGDGASFGWESTNPRHGHMLNGPRFSAPTVKSGINHAIRCCGEKNAELACVINGREWTIFRRHRADAKSPCVTTNSIQQPGISGAAGDAGSDMQRLVDTIAGGAPVSSTKCMTDEVRYHASSFDLMLHPVGRADEHVPRFQLREWPDSGPACCSSVPTRSAHPGDGPPHRNDRSGQPRKGRGRDAAPRQTRRAALSDHRQFRPDREGDRLPVDNLMLLYTGPLSGFPDRSIWSAPDDWHSRGVAELIAQEKSRSAIAALRTPMWTAMAVLDVAIGTGIGVYRTSLLPHERFGAGEPVRRHHASGLREAQDLCVAFEVRAI